MVAARSNRPPVLWPALGPGPPCTDLSRHTRRSPAEPHGYIYKCSQYARDFRHATRWISVSAVGRGISADLWRDDFLWYRYAIGAGQRFSSRPFQLHERGPNLVLSLPTDEPPSGKVENLIVLSQEFYNEIMDHPIPTNLEAAKALSSAPAALDLYTWLTYRCFSAKGEERVPLFGEFGLVNQLGIGGYGRPRKFREQLKQWLILVKTMWPECPARVSGDGGALMVGRANAIISVRRSREPDETPPGRREFHSRP
jgi:hypothetical protein